MLTQVAKEEAGPDDDPCHTQLSAIFDDQKVQTEPADVMLSFMKDYCVEASDDFLPSKLLIGHALGILTLSPGLCAFVMSLRNRDTLLLLLHWKHHGKQSEGDRDQEPESPREETIDLRVLCGNGF